VVWFSTTERSYLAAGLFVLAALTDVVDGWLARARGEVSNLGKLLDPVADKALQLSALFLVVRSGYSPLWLVLVLLGKELALLLGGLFMLRNGIVVSARFYGKLASLLLFVALTAGLAGMFSWQPLLYLGASVSCLAGLDYLIQAVRTFSSRRISG
jgi:CDP-diacylglycerol--glycerol-3-phosphate 3-phosphatidyltransferase